AGPFKSGLLVSAVMHASMVVALVFWASSEVPVRPPIYRVELVGAPPGKRQEGVVDAAPEPAAPKPAPSGAERPVPAATPLPSTAKPVVKTPQATPSPSRTKTAGARTATPEPKATAAPQAGAGAQGGKGADVANVSIRGIEFPFPGYLNNIQRQIALNWTPRRTSAALVTEVKFTIRRDGSVVGMEIMKSSGDALYNADAMGAIEAVGSTRRFGPLPPAFPDDVLVVYFTFDYAFRP
ncbi:MAG: energy transducer TonB, partial [Gemmatimonas sp.]